MRFSLLHLTLATLSSIGFASAGQDPYLGEIILFSGAYEPKGWVFCDGRRLLISQNSALYSILGTTYGGNGVQDFAVPDLRGRVPVGYGAAQGVPSYSLGQTGGGGGSSLSGSASGSISIGVNNLPAHGHTGTFQGQSATTSFDTKITVAQAPGQAGAVASGFLSQGSNSGTGQANIFVGGDSSATKVQLNGGSSSITTTPAGSVNVGSTGGGQPLPIGLQLSGQAGAQMPPFLGMNYIIAVQGIYPSRS